MITKLLLWDKGKLIEVPPTLAEIIERERLREI